MAGRLGLVAWLMAWMFAAPLCPLVCAQLQMRPAHDIPSAPPGSCHEKPVPASDHLPGSDPDESPFHSCERCANLQQAVKSSQWTPALNSVFPVSEFLDYATSALSGHQPTGIENRTNPPASPPIIKSILRI
jgi:hypothetical protein